MPKQPRGVLLAMISLDRTSTIPLYKQLDTQLRAAILSRGLPPGTRLPASRQLAAELVVSRLTVQNTYEQLVAEGFLRASVGSGTFVAEIAPLELPPKCQPLPLSSTRATRALSERGRRVSTTLASTRLAGTRPFRPGVPALDLFPMATWARLWSRRLQRGGADLLGYGESAGYAPLRRKVAAYLRDARGVSCDPAQVVITAGTQHALALSALTILDAGDCVWFEEPGHTAGRDLLTAQGLEVVPATIDEDGLDLFRARASHPAPRLIFVTPSHQHPLGVTMSLNRRLELLSFAYEQGAWILEDDYDSEYRYAGRPIAAMQGLDTQGCVIYAGTFSKVLFPSLRIGYVVVPTDLVSAFCAAQVLLNQAVPALPQAVLADFIAEGHFTTHLRKMRAAYAERQAVLLASLARHLGDVLNIGPTDAGMHVIGWLPDGVDEIRVLEAVWAAGIEALPMSIYCAEPFARSGIILGFSGTPPAQIEPNVAILARAIRSVPADSRPGTTR